MESHFYPLDDPLDSLEESIEQSLDPAFAMHADPDLFMDPCDLRVMSSISALFLTRRYPRSYV